MTNQQHSGTEPEPGGEAAGGGSPGGATRGARTAPDARRWALGAIFGSALAILVAYLSAFLPGGSPPWAAWLFMAGMSVMMVASMALGAARNGSIGKLSIPFSLVLVILLVGFGTVLALPPADPADPTLWLGLPPRAAIVLLGIGLLPLFVVPVAYAWTFPEQTLAPGDLDRIRDEALRARGEPESGSAGQSAAPEPGDAA